MGVINEKVRDRLFKLKALAERGVGGEAENAQHLLEQLMRQHNITDDDIADELVSEYSFDYSTDIQLKLLNQIIFMVTGTGTVSYWKDKRRKKQVFVKCTAAQKIEIELNFEFYNRAFQQEFDVFYRAFVQKNSLFPDDSRDKEGIPQKPTDPKTLMKMAQMMAGMDRHHIKKMIAE